MVEEYEKNKRRQVTNMRSVADYGMGTLFLLIGLYLLLYRVIGVNILNREPSSYDYLFGALFTVYGAWRIYRGYKKNYFK